MTISKTVMVSMVGRPNVGKSTLTNTIVGQKVAIVSRKPQTTRTRITAVHNEGSCQFVFLDTPGLHKPKSRLGDYMVKVVENTVADVDAAVILVEPIANVGAPEQALIDRVKACGIPAVLVINKIDTVKKEELLDVIAAYGAVYDFDAIIPVSAVKREGIDELLRELEKFAVEGPQLFPDDMISDQPERQLVAEIIREKLLRLLDAEIPHGTAVEITDFKERENGNIYIGATIYCERESHKGIIIGKSGSMLKKVGALSRRDIEGFLDAQVYLELWVKVREDWRNNPAQIRNFGYEEG